MATKQAKQTRTKSAKGTASTDRSGQRSGATQVSAPTPAPAIRFPKISHKEDLQCRSLLEDQILLIDDYLTPAECKAFVNTIDSLPLELTPPKKRGEAERLNFRLNVSSPELAEQMYSSLVPHLPTFPYPTSARRTARETAPRTPHSLNSNIRFYKYTPSQQFGPHYDDSVRDPTTGAKSEWTLLIYVSGVEDGVEGGEGRLFEKHLCAALLMSFGTQTLFYQTEKCRPEETIRAPLTRGTALLHRHGQECMLHEGSQVKKGIKYVLRSDLMFKS